MLDFKKRVIPPPAKKITLKNLRLSSRKSYPGPDFHLSTRTAYNLAMKLSGTLSLGATYNCLVEDNYPN